MALLFILYFRLNERYDNSVIARMETYSVIARMETYSVIARMET